jgi:hypothetical protein
MAHVCQKLIFDPIGMFEFRIDPLEFCSPFDNAHFEIEVGALQVIKQLGIINCEGRLPSQGFKKFQPLGFSFQVRMMILLMSETISSGGF